MNVLLIGSGGREHALAWKLAQSPLIDTLFVAPGNPGTAQVGRNLPVEVLDIPQLVEVAQREQVGLVVVGPEAPLAAGLADACLKAGIAVFGPTAAAAQIESSKAFAKRLMIEAGIPTAEARIFDDPDRAADFVRTTGRAWVVKADGLAAGKGVIVPESVGDALDAIRTLSATRAGARLLLEERLSGPEVSLIALCDGERALPLPPAQDHKRLRDGDAGPNTGGMGAYAPAPHLTPADIADLTAQIILPALRALKRAGTPFCGALYAGLILAEHGPRVLEFNARFGDPETQAILPLLEGDLLVALAACAGNGTLSDELLRQTANAAACVVLAAEGYPDTPRRGDVISGIESISDPNVLIFHAGTAWKNGQLTTAGGRVLGVTGIGATLREALARAYAAVDRISFPGMHYRRDIGAKALQ
ncbi:MAG: phosphoribosylamine--glycine ligase [Roseiflexus sp.]|nr:phosphoribosylamine--glycine ligase [Roseiflexus sp.]MCS7289842.1 phosphoribosylamine--glycine ligase [Roseiflexus sp.]MDW8146582.1 phosphoribosylamine--glycine ligase [Roseiflexaceae bacterium]MDW8231142.1 phosphoribosylamine--glycine ligase [Roseiflexaceae bacterium]